MRRVTAVQYVFRCALQHWADLAARGRWRHPTHSVYMEEQPHLMRLFFTFNVFTPDRIAKQREHLYRYFWIFGSSMISKTHYMTNSDVKRKWPQNLWTSEICIYLKNLSLLSEMFFPNLQFFWHLKMISHLKGSLISKSWHIISKFYYHKTFNKVNKDNKVNCIKVEIKENLTYCCWHVLCWRHFLIIRIQ